MSRNNNSEIGGAFFRLRADSTELESGLSRAEMASQRASTTIAGNIKTAILPMRQLVGAIQNVIGAFAGLAGIAATVAAPILLVQQRTEESRKAFGDLLKEINLVKAATRDERWIRTLVPSEADAERAARAARAPFDKIIQAAEEDDRLSISQRLRIYEEATKASTEAEGNARRDAAEKSAKETQAILDKMAKTIKEPPVKIFDDATAEDFAKAMQMAGFEAEQALRIAKQRKEAEDAVTDALRKQTAELRRQQEIFEDLQRRQLGSGLAGLGSFGPLVQAIDRLNTNMQGRGR